jgi:hypothetical protein
VNARLHVADKKNWYYASCPKDDCPEENNEQLFPREAQLTGAGGGSQARLEIPCTRQCMGSKTAKYTPYKEHGKMKDVPDEHRKQARKPDSKGNLVWSDFSIPKPYHMFVSDCNRRGLGCVSLMCILGRREAGGKPPVVRGLLGMLPGWLRARESC